MKDKMIGDIPLIDFGNKITIKGIFFGDDSDTSFIALLPQEHVVEMEGSIITPTINEWHDIFEQQDYNYVEGQLNGERVILRKSQRNVDGKISWKVFKRDGYKCRYCGIDHVPLTVDHIITWETGGATHVDNLVTSCRKCNRVRGNTPYDQWVKSKYYQEKMQFLDDDVIHQNATLVSRLETLPRVSNKRKR